MEKVRLDTLRAEQERQAAAAKAATKKDEARKEAKGIKRLAKKELKKVSQAELAEELAAGRAAVAALAEFEAVAKATAAIKQALEDKTLTLVRPTRRMLKVFLFRPTHVRANCASGLSCRGHRRGRDDERD